MSESYKVECHIQIAMNEDGDWVVVSADDGDSISTLLENCGGTLVRVVDVVVRMDAPVEVKAVVNVPASAGETVEATAAE